MPVWPQSHKIHKLSILLEKLGAGERIRTVDPNLGEVNWRTVGRSRRQFPLKRGWHTKSNGRPAETRPKPAHLLTRRLPARQKATGRDFVMFVKYLFYINKILVQLGGLEPPTSGSTIRRSNQLSYNCTSRGPCREGPEAMGEAPQKQAGIAPWRRIFAHRPVARQRPLACLAASGKNVSS
jgi:hypothetical protein